MKKIIEYLLYAFIFLLPLQTRWIYSEQSLNGDIWEFGRLGIYGTDIVFWFIAVLFLVNIIKTKVTAIPLPVLRDRFFKTEVLAYFFLALFVLLLGVSIFWSPEKNVSLHFWFRFLQAGALLAMLIYEPVSVKKIYAVLLASGSVQAIFAFWQFFSQFVFANKWLGLAEHLPEVSGSVILVTQSERWLRAYGSLPHPNMLGGFLAICLIAGFYLLNNIHIKIHRMLILAALGICSFGIFFTFSRSAYLALAVAGIFFIVIAIKNISLRKPLFIWFAILLCSFTSLTLLLPELVFTRLTGSVYTEVASIELRLEYTKQAITLFTSHPFIGVGLGGYTLAVFEELTPRLPGYLYQPVHNIYLLIIAEVGLPMFLLWFLAVLLLMYSLIKRGVAALYGGFSLLLTVALISFFDHYFWTSAFGIWLMWLVLGINFRFSR